MTQSVFTAILGVPNVGKSTLLNRIVGEKIAIVSPKPQTTRTRVTGVLTEGETQFVFLDTPGIHKPRTLLGEGMIKTIGEAASGVDAALLLCEPQGAGLSPVGEFLERLKKSKVPVILCVNKIDTLREKEALLPLIAKLTEDYDFEAVLPISAVTGEGEFRDLFAAGQTVTLDYTLASGFDGTEVVFEITDVRYGVNADIYSDMLLPGAGGTCTAVPAVKYVRGDLTGDDRVTSDDAVYLLRHTLFPNDYPL